MYELAIETSFTLPGGEMDAVLLYDDKYEKLIEIAKPFIEAGYKTSIEKVDEE